MTDITHEVPPETDRLLPLDEVKMLLGGCGTTHLYALMARGDLTARKLGRRTLIPASSVQRYIASLPAAKITTGQNAT